MSLASDLLQRHEQLRNRRALYEALWEEIARYLVPERRGLAEKGSEGGKLTEYVYDSTAIDCAQKLAARLQGIMCSQAAPWFALEVRDDGINADSEVARWFDAAASRMSLAFSQSNFYNVIDEVFSDLVAFGMGGVYCEERAPTTPGFNGLVFTSCALADVAVDEDAEGRIDTVFRTFTLSARAALARWPKGLSPRTRERAEKSPYRPVSFLHAVYPREGGRLPKVDDATGLLRPLRADKLPVASVYLETAEKHVVAEGGYHEMPYPVARWRKASGELYGRGLGATALPDAASLNALQREVLTMIPLAVKPPLKARHNGVVGVVRWQPGGVTTVRNMDDLAAMTSGANFEVGKLGVMDLRAAIRAIFLVDQLTLKETPQMTAMEVAARMELMQQLLGPAFGRIQYELFNGLIERVFGIMLRAGAFPSPIPPRLLQYVLESGEWDIEYQSPLARAQRTPELAAIDRTITAVGAMQTVYPEVKDVVDADGAIREYAEIAGLPSKLIRSKDEVAQIRKARADAQAQTEALAQANTIADSMGKVAPFVKAVSPQEAPA